MPQKKSKITIGNIILRLFAHFLFFTGLSVLIPFVALANVPTGIIFINKPLLQMALMAGIFVIISIFILYYCSHSFGKTFTNLGLITLFSGGLGILFSIYSKEVIFQILKEYITAFDKVQPFLEVYITHSLPKVRILTIGYIVLGIILLTLGTSMRKKEKLVGFVRRRYGPRVRVYKK